MLALFERIRDFALAAGGPGLFVAAFLDGSFVPLPEINDLLVVLMVMRRPSGLLYYAGMTTLGSVAGCFVLYALARKGGSGFLRRRMSLKRGDQVLGLYQRYGLLALMVPALLPPPAPFKVFVLLAGVAGVGPVQFAFGIGLARALRYGTLGWLAIRYGEPALDLVRKYGPQAALILVGAIVLGSVAYWFVMHRRRQQQID